MKIVVTGGGTIAPIDDVRQIANVSTGRFSADITEAFLRQGAEVTHIHAPSAILPFQRATRLDLESEETAEFERLRRVREHYGRVRDRLHLRPIGTGRVHEYAEVLRSELVDRQVDAVLLAMAVSDYEPEPIAGKIGSDRSTLTLTLHPTPKVIRQVRAWSPDVYLVGFKLLSGVTSAELIETARTACVTNRADLTVANDLASIRQGRHVVQLVGPEGLRETLGPEGCVAEALASSILNSVNHRKAAR